jgi:signal transduction histidine kinase
MAKDHRAAAQNATKAALWPGTEHGTILHNALSMARPADMIPILNVAAIAAGPSRALHRTCAQVRRMLTVLWWIVASTALPQQAAAQTSPTPDRFADALVADDPGSSAFPSDAPWRVIPLPDDWALSRPQQRTPVWYRMRFDAVGARERDGLLGVLIERACSEAEVQLNGQQLHAATSMSEPVNASCERPLLVALPRSLVTERGNTLDIRLAGYDQGQVASRQRAAGLSAPRIGPYAALHADHAELVLLKTTLPLIACATLLSTGVVLFMMGWWYRRQEYLRHFGALAFGWGLVTARLWWHDAGQPNFARELVLVALLPLVALAAVQFLLQYANKRSRPLEVAMVVQCAVVPASLLLAGPLRLNAIATTWYLLLAIQVVGAIVFYLWTTWHERVLERRRNFWPMLTLLALAASMVAVELVAQQRLLALPWRLLPALGLPLVFVTLGLWLVRDYARALQAAEISRVQMETRMRDASAVMERSFSQMAELRVEQVTQQERKRIAADLHDDLGAKLLTIVHTSESERISTLAREALEEMRLSVRGLTGKPVKLIDALGDWRAEVVGRLSQTGVEGEWQAPTEELPQTLSARAYVQTTRILREAVNNIIKHSGASRCSIRCTLNEGDFQLKIQDNGKGIPLELDGRLDRGHGMSSMKHRAKQLQGQCLVESGPGYGTVIRLTIPLEKHTLPA